MARRLDSEKHAEWRKQLGRFSRCGLTVARFCSGERVSVASFYYWRRKLRQAARRRRLYVPVTCTLVFSPVCGCVGWTCGNECMADSAGASINHLGSCVQPCCDPSEEPGVGDYSPCVEDATCCANGQWQCNLGDGTSSCAAVGDVCRVCGGSVVESTSERTAN